MRRAIGLVSAVLLLSAPSALAQDGTAGGEQAPPPGADEYTQKVRQGIEHLISGEHDSAESTFRQAIELDSTRPQAVFYLAEAQRMSGDLETALGGFRHAAELAQSAGEPRWQARGLEGVAMTLERMDGRIEDARSAWQAYIDFADQNQTVAHPQLGRARIQAIDMMNEQEQVYVGVRERIAERERELAEQHAEEQQHQGRRGRRRRRH